MLFKELQTHATSNSPNITITLTMYVLHKAEKSSALSVRPYFCQVLCRVNLSCTCIDQH